MVRVRRSWMTRMAVVETRAGRCKGKGCVVGAMGIWYACPKKVDTVEAMLVDTDERDRARGASGTVQTTRT